MAQQNLDFNIAANVKGMEAIATLINRVGALEAETKRLTTANAGLASSTDVVIRNGVRYNNAMDAQSRQLRQARQGTQQLGMQINDFATSVSSGSSVTQAFTQQLGQVGFAMSQMGGTAGKIGNFLAGPWGAAILIGAMALNPLIQKLWEMIGTANKAEGALANLIKRRAQELLSRNEVVDSEKGLKKLLDRRKELEDAIAKKGRRDAQGRLMFVYAEQKALSEVNDEIARGRDAIDSARTTKLGLGLESVTRDLYKPEKAIKEKTGGAGTGAADKALKEAEKAKERLAEIQRDIERIRNVDDQSRAKMFTDMANDQQVTMQETIANIQEMAAASVATLSERVIKPFDDALAQLNQSYEAIGNTVADSFQGMLTGAMSWKEGMKGIINSVINELWRLYVVQQIVGMVTNFLGGLGLPTGGIGKNANGTQNWKGGPTWVGERGPEIVNLPKGSSVIPAHRAQSMGGGGVTVNVDARGSADPAAVRAQVQQGILEAAPSIIAAAEARTVQGLRRPRLGGSIR